MREWLVTWATAAAALSIAGCSDRSEEVQTSAGASTTNVESQTGAAPALEEPAAESGLAMKRGVLSLRADRSTFRPCDESADLWVLDQTDGALTEAFLDELRAGPTTLYVEVYGERLSAQDAPDARGHAGVLVLEQVLYAGLADAIKGCQSAPSDYIVSARGTEPFWSVEVRDEQILWRQPEAPTQVVLNEPHTEDAEGAVRYRATNADHEIDLLIDARSCRDAMSGEFFAYSARAVLDGEEFNGCARVGR